MKVVVLEVQGKERKGSGYVVPLEMALVVGAEAKISQNLIMFFLWSVVVVQV